MATPARHPARPERRLDERWSHPRTCGEVIDSPPRPPRGRLHPPTLGPGGDAVRRTWEPGEQVEVKVQPRGGGPEQSRGSIVLEDLGEVVTRIASRRGPSGPNAPITQFMLSEATRHLSERLGQELVEQPLAEDSVPRVLSALIGHEPFVENVLKMSVHQMRRRWPLAGDWYADVIS